ncbi:MAG: hypothetical protein JST28_23060 [Acidobacteria bacterium]|nr:hypothetical protein [Acidobacteriota bacterium]
MKPVFFILLTSVCAAGQAANKITIIDFDPADREHCRMVTIEGRPLRQTTAAGTSVAIGSPSSTIDGEFRVFIAIRQTGEGKARIKPGDFSALYSDPAHTRFTFHDIGAEMDAVKMRQARDESSSLALNPQGDPRSQSLDAGSRDRVPNVRRRSRGNLNGPARSKADADEKMPGSVSLGDLYLRGVTLKAGGYASGVVYFRKPRRSPVKPGPADSLVEIDIPVNGLIFRFK